MELLFKIGFLELRLLDVLDIVLVGLLLFQLYKLLRGGLAFNIFIGLLLIYIIWLLVKALNMQLLTSMLGQFINVGVIALLIVFQPEIRRFLIYIGKGSLLRGRNSFFRKFFTKRWKVSLHEEELVNDITKAVATLVANKSGAIIVFGRSSKLQLYANSGVIIDGVISTLLIETIFNKNNPMHDGAIIIADNKIVAAKCVLPISDNPDLPADYGLRHRAAIGITEHSDAIAIVLSEERGAISIAQDGKIIPMNSVEDMKNYLRKELFEEMAA